jgi:copper chaperone
METADIRVDGMSCGGCEDRLTEALGRVAGVGSVAADHEKGNVRVMFDSQRISEADLRERITLCGFDPLDD